MIFIQGLWLFIALASLSGFSVILPVPWGAVFFFHLIWIQIVRTHNRKLVFKALTVYILSILAGLWSHSTHITHLKASDTSFHMLFQNGPSIDGNLLKAKVFLPEKKERLVLQYTIPSQMKKAELQRTIRPGTECIAEGKLSEPEKNRNENLFNYKFYLEEENIHWTFKAGSLDFCKQGKTGMAEKIEALREKGMEQVQKTFIPATVPYAEALLFGDSSNFDDQQYAMFQRLGVVHLLAISGLQVNILAYGLFFILIRLGFTRESSRAVLLLILPIYAIICGSNPPVVRAVFMSMLLLGSKKNMLSGLDALSISFLVCMFYNPCLLFNIGFQLSFLVSLSILLSSRTILARQSNALVNMMKISLVSQVVSLPILMYSFFQISVISLLTNLIFVPFYSFLLTPLILINFVLSLICDVKGLTMILHPLFFLLSNLLTILIKAEEIIAEQFNQKWAVLVTGKPCVFLLLGLFACVFLFYILWEKGYKLWKAGIPFLVLMTGFILFQTFNPFGEVTFIDIGQGDSILIKLPFNRGIYLIDTGGEVSFEQENWEKRLHQFHVGNDILIPYLKSKGIRKIDKLILTHSDQDHIGAARELMKEIGIQTLYISPNAWRKPLMYQTVKAAVHERIPIERIKAGYSWKNASGFFLIVSPLTDVYEGNNSSLVLYAAFGGETWLFTGDLEKKGEERLLKAYNIQANILKAGHHGSRTASSEKFIEQIKPKLAVISAGKNNRFGHPHQEVLDTLNSHHVLILRTDQMGAVHYRFFQNHGTFSVEFP